MSRRSGFTNSPLATRSIISPNKTSGRDAILGITPHVTAGTGTAAGTAEWLARPTTKASANYVIGGDGAVVLGVDEKDRSWCTSSTANDKNAITIEVCNTVAAHPWPVSDKALDTLVDLCTDICRRNNIAALKFIRDDKSLAGKWSEQNLTLHRWFANKACPGDYLISLYPAICKEVNSRLAGNAPKQISKDNPAPVVRPVLRNGSNGGAVKELQAKLNAHGASPALSVDGGFGPLTEAAVRAFQTAKGLLVDGVVGSQTWAALDKAPQAVTPPPAPTPAPEQPASEEFINADEAIAFWMSVGVIGSPAYWQNKVKEVPWLGKLLNAQAEYARMK